VRVVDGASGESIEGEDSRRRKGGVKHNGLHHSFLC